MLLKIYVKDETLKEMIVEAINEFMRYHDEDIIDEFLEQAGITDFNGLAKKLLDDEDFVRDYTLQITHDLESGNDLDYSISIAMDAEFFVKRIQPYYDSCRSTIIEKKQKEIDMAKSLLRAHGYIIS